MPRNATFYAPPPTNQELRHHNPMERTTQSPESQQKMSNKANPGTAANHPTDTTNSVSNPNSHPTAPLTATPTNTSYPTADQKTGLSRRHFLGGAATALGALGLAPNSLANALGRYSADSTFSQEPWDFDSMARLSSNENPWGPSPMAMKAMESAWKYANRYGYPDADVRQVIADHLGVPADHIMLTAGSEEVLRTVGLTFLSPGKKVVGVEPTYSSVYRYASGVRADAIAIPLLPDHTQDIPAIIAATKRYHRDVGFVYLCNPNNPTGRVVSGSQVRQVIAQIPPDVPVLVDEAYHHFVEEPEYESAVPYVTAGRNVIVARTFSKIYGMAGLRLGYAVTAPSTLARLQVYSPRSINALVKWGGAASIQDTEGEAKVRAETLRLRKETVAQVEDWGFNVIPSETNFFMMHTGRPVSQVREAFRREGVAVGRPFPPMLDYLRVSIGNAEEMERFKDAFRKVFQV